VSLESPAVRWALVLTVVTAAQVSLVGDLSLFGVHPDLLLLLTVAAGLTGGPGRGVVVGFVVGVIADLFLHTRFGVATLASTLVGYAAGVAGDTVVRPSTPVWMAATAGLSAIGTVLYAALAHLLGSQNLADPNLIAIVGIVSLVNAALCVPALAVCRWAGDDRSAVRIR
jgi:rod shape-determining protein MreD